MTKEQKKALKENGWVKTPIGEYRTRNKTGNINKQITAYDLYVRKTNFDEFLKNSSKWGGQKTLTNPVKSRVYNMGSTPPMGDPEVNLTPSSVDSNRNSSDLPELASFNSYPSLLSIREEKPCILIGFDSEWQSHETGRDMLSWQFAVIWDNNLYEFVFLKACDKNLPFDMALGCILDTLNIASVDVRKLRKYRYCIGWDKDTPITVDTFDVTEARSCCVYTYQDGVFTHDRISSMGDRFLPRSGRSWGWFHTFLDYSSVESVKVTLLCHAGKVDISSLSFDKSKYILKYLSDVQGGLVSLQPIRVAPKNLVNVSNTCVYPVSLSVSDTMCHAPGGMKKLEDLGHVVGIEKIDLDKYTKSHMLQLLQNDPVLFFNYASKDSVVTLLYASSMYGYNNTLPVTVTSATASVMKVIMMKVLNCGDTADFNKKYRGLQKVSHGLVARADRPGYVESTSLEPISDIVNTIQYYASQAYHGGYNSCSEVGYFSQETFDYDLRNAYPTAMCLIPDIDWENPVRHEVLRRNLDIRDWVGVGGFNPITPFVGYVRFTFPENVKYPCIPVNVDGVPVYPRTSDGIDGVYVAGPYIFLALKLGAEVYCERGYFLNTLFDDSGKESRSLSFAVKQFVKDRNLAKDECGKKSLEELILKTMVNSGYGKNAQNVVVKSSWTAFKDVMEDLGCSAITNPVSAMMITSLVQCELLAAQNQMHEREWISCSVTTDGFISDCPEDILQALDLYGFKPFMESARIFLTGNPELWEVKHHQNDLINFTTRGNVSLCCEDRDGYDGVCAHNSTKSGFDSDSYEDRLWLMTKVLSRTGTVDYTEEEWTSFKELVHGKPFTTKSVTRHIRMDFDMKRKPDRNSFHTDRPIVEGIEYEIAHFDTLPYEDVAEFRLYRQKKKLTSVLRTESDWDIFWLKLDMNVCGSQIHTDIDWSILFSCVMGFRAGRWSIPKLEVGTVEEKCAWLNTHNDSKKSFKPSDWKNARRPERQVNMLPEHLLMDKLEELIDDL